MLPATHAAAARATTASVSMLFIAMINASLQADFQEAA